MWTWLILFCVVTMIVGPIMLLEPNAFMRRQTKLRAYANQQGFTIRLRPSRYLKINESRAIYFLPHKHSLRKKIQLQK